MNRFRKNLAFGRRLGFALAGLGLAWRRERSLRTQAVVAGFLILVLAALGASALWWALAGLAATTVMAAEVLNAAIERLVDHLHPDDHPAVRETKDMAAGGVLLAAFGALWVGLLLLFGS